MSISKIIMSHDEWSHFVSKRCSCHSTLHIDCQLHIQWNFTIWKNDGTLRLCSGAPIGRRRDLVCTDSPTDVSIRELYYRCLHKGTLLPMAPSGNSLSKKGILQEWNELKVLYNSVVITSTNLSRLNEWYECKQWKLQLDWHKSPKLLTMCISSIINSPL